MTSSGESRGGPTAAPRPRVPEAPSAPTLVLARVHKHWPGRPEPVLAGVDLEIGPASVVWLEGANGAGKTTLLRIVAALIKPDAGHVRLAGVDPERARLAYQSRLGFVSTGYGSLYARLTVAQHLELWARLALLPRRARRGAIERSLRRFALTDLAGGRADRLSMGQRQRLRLAMGFLHDPLLVLLDEPGNSLDGDGRAVLVDAVEEVAARGGVVVWAAPSGEEPRLDVQHRLVVAGGQVHDV